MLQTNWSKYYTPEIVANEIISKLPKNYKPNLAIDICVGSGNFLDVAFKKWTNINLVGVDLCVKNVQNDNNYDLYTFDALNMNKLRTVLSPYLSSNKLLLANPPFGKIDDLSRYIEYNNKEDSVIYNAALKSQRIESLMLVSNLSILKDGDYFGAILPENFFTSNKLREFRKMFISNFGNILIGNSEQHFPTSDVKTRMFIGKYKGNGIRVEDHSSKKNEVNNILDFKLYRGIDNSLLITEEQICNEYNYNEVLHFSNSKGKVLRKKFIITNSKYDKLKVSEDDTLILRVGRNSGLAFRSSKFYSGKYVSDYFYILKDLKISRKQHLNLELNLKNKVNGLTVNYLKKSDIISGLNEIL